MTPLAGLLRRRIAANGPMNVADFMSECLLHPQHGYYSTRDPLGAQGDFTTAPEISQMFGELLGLLLAQVWMDQGRPAPFILAEPGPGRGTLMADILRATRVVPGFSEAAQVHLIEASPALRARQNEALKGHDIRWHTRIEKLPEGPLFLVANEFFDALPIRQFTRDKAGWRELQIVERAGALAFALSGPAPLAFLEHRLADTRPGDVVEICPAAAPIMGTIADRIARNGGVAVIIDYGNWRSRSDTLQAVRRHRPEPVLAHPGQADITAHVDFEALASAGASLAHTNLADQRHLLERLGIHHRAEVLSRKLQGKALENHQMAVQRLTDASQMGTLFKAIAFYPRTAPPPPGFAP